MRRINRLSPLLVIFTILVNPCEMEELPDAYTGELIYEVYDSNIKRNCNSLFFVNQMIGYATQGGEVFKTSNGGEKWNKLNIASPVPLKSFYFLNKDVGYVFGGNSGCSPSPCNPYGSIAYKTSNGGETWLRQNIPYERSSLNSAYFVDENNGVASGTRLSIKTTNGEMTWESTIIANNFISKIIFLNQNVGYALDNLGRLHQSTDRGESWNAISIEGNKLTTDFCFPDADTGFASCFNRLLKTTNGGNSWNLIDTLYSTIDFIHFVNENTGVTISKRDLSNDIGFTSPTLKHVIKYTKDGGQTWTTLELKEKDFNDRCLFAKGNIIYSLAYDKIFKLRIE